MTIRNFLVAASALALLPAAAMAEHHEAGDMKAAKGPASPAALAAAFCAGVVAEDAAALADLYTEDADSYGPGGDVVKGREAIAASWAPFFDGFDNITCDLENAGEVNNGKNATVWGLWTMTGTPAGGGDTVTMNGRYMDISVKEGGVWRYRADHASMMAPAGEAE
ncbi:YybH family protein [Hyphococcus sp.]|uniref:YybH family protein n=1 Tax=Hyphococcus sp. TaxID=2038636 RepID=UPI00208C0C63|nr:MAG: hypothetical protein DHS20C04_26140 [Marinicaulis sp.]